ncbi:MAG: Dam family site-specific DNA-(adenine-N6)-methyltransferase [Cyanobacteriota bacterium]
MLEACPPITPYLKYPGGKRRLVPQIAQYYEPYRQSSRFVDLFCGSAAVSLGLRPVVALLNDACRPLIGLHRWVQRGWGNASESGGYWVNFENDKAVYYKNRDRFNQLIARGLDWTLEAGLLLYYLNRTGFNGLMRFSKSGVYNVPYGHYRKISYCENFSRWRSPMQGWEFTSADFTAVQLAPTDFVYADPPYDSVKNSGFEQLSLLGIEHQGGSGHGFVGYSGAFGWGDQVRLAQYLAQHSGPALVSNAATHRVVQLYQDLGFEVTELGVRRSISCKGDRPLVQEIFAFKEGHHG